MQVFFIVYISVAGCWTEWFDRDDPTGKGDWETLDDLYSENLGKLCNSPLYIEVQTTDGHSAASTGDIIAKCVSLLV